MSFVWFHNSSNQPQKSASFYHTLLGWSPSEGPPGMTMFAGSSGPFAAVAAQDNGVAAWIPYVEVDNVDAATQKALTLGATLLADKTRGPAGEFTMVKDPGGATVALWQKG